MNSRIRLFRCFLSRRLESHSNSKTLAQYVNCTFEHSVHKLGILFESKNARIDLQGHQAHRPRGGCSGVERKRNLCGILEFGLSDTKVSYQSFLSDLSHLSSGQ